MFLLKPYINPNRNFINKPTNKKNYRTKKLKTIIYFNYNKSRLVYY